MGTLEQLQEFLLAHFSASEVRMFISCLPASRRLTDELPGDSVSPRELAFAAVQVLDRHAALDAAFWAGLRGARPHLVVEVTAIEASQGVSRSASLAGLSLVMARATRHRDHAEVEFIVQNEGHAAQFITELRLEARQLVADLKPVPWLRYHQSVEGFRVLLTNVGWSDLEIEGTVSVRWFGPNMRLQKVTCCLPPGGEAEIARIATPALSCPAAVHIAGRYRERYGAWRSLYRTLSSPRPAASHIAEPRTAYICMFETAGPTQRRFNVVRAVPRGHADIFACIVSADRSCAFDLVVEVVTASGTVLESQHAGLAVVRRPNDGWDVENGDEFALGADGVWSLGKRPWRRGP